MNTGAVLVRDLGRVEYSVALLQMQVFTDARDETTPDEIWVLEHDPVFTQGQRGGHEHLLEPGHIPVIQSDRGGQVTYHGPGQLVVYLLLDIRRLGIGVRGLVTTIESAIIELLDHYGIGAVARREAPGVYVGKQKVAALGLRVRRGCSYHGLSLNVDMDLAPFTRINPCGYAGLEVTQLRNLGVDENLSRVAERLVNHLSEHFGYDAVLQKQSK